MLFAGQHISKSPFEVEVGMAQGDSSKATAQGPGLEPSGNIANKTTYFEVYTAGNVRRRAWGLISSSIIRLESVHEYVLSCVLSRTHCSCSPIPLIPLPFLLGAGIGEVEVVIMDPAGKKNTVTCNIEDKGNSSYRCTYKPTLEGQHIIYVTFAGGQISKSPFTVNVGEGKSYRFDSLAARLF